VRSRASRWASDLNLPLLVAAMDAAWIAPYALLLGAIWSAPGTPLMRAVSLFGLLAGGQALTRSLLSWPAAATHSRIWIPATGAVAVVAAVALQYGGDPWWKVHGSVWWSGDAALAVARPEVPALVLGALAWRRGVAIGRTDLEYYDVESVFHLGLVALGAFALITAFGTGVTALVATASAAFPFLATFFATGLVALPVARIRSIRQRTRAAADAVTISSEWYTVIGLSVAAILGTAAAAAVLLRFNLRGLLQAVGHVVNPVLWALLYVIALPLGFAVSALIWLIRRLMQPGAHPPLQVPGPPSWVNSFAHQNAAGLSPGAAMALRWGLGLIIAALLILWIVRAVFRYERTEKEPTADETCDSIFSWADLRAGLWSWLHRRRQAGRHASAAPTFGTGAAANVRRAYAEFLGLAAARGTPRAPYLTPAEFAVHLRAGWPAVAASADQLTAVYSRTRYGLASPSAQDLEIVQRALTTIHEAFVDRGEMARNDRAAFLDATPRGEKWPGVPNGGSPGNGRRGPAGV
jgi:hypothetical protein